jgi:hypothetical protein
MVKQNLYHLHVKQSANNVMGMKEKICNFYLIDYFIFRSGCKEGKKRIHCRSCHGQGKIIVFS